MYGSSLKLGMGGEQGGLTDRSPISVASADISTYNNIEKEFYIGLIVVVVAVM